MVVSVPEQAIEELERATAVPALLRATCRELVELVDASACLLSRVIGELLIEVAEDTRAGGTLQLGHGYLIPDYPLTEEVIARGEARLVSLRDRGPDPSEAALLRELGFESLLMLPLHSGGECWGLIELYRAGGTAFLLDDAQLATPVVARCGELLASRCVS